MRLLSPLATLLARLIQALIGAFDRPPVPRLIRFSLHPWVKRGHAKILAGGRRTFRWIRLAPAAIAVAIFLLFAVAAHGSGDGGGLLLAMPSLLTTARELRAERATLIAENRKILDKAEAEKRDLDATEKDAYDKAFAKAEELRARFERLEKQEREERELEGRQSDPPKPEPDKPAPKPGEARTEKRSFVIGAHGHIRGERTFVFEGPTATEEYRDAFRHYLQTGERRNTLQAGDDEGGGFLVAPQQFVADLIAAVDDQVFIRGLADVQMLSGAASWGRPSRETDMDDFDWTTELATGTEDTKLKYGKREMRPHPMAKRVKVSRTLLRLSALAMETEVRGRIGYKFGVTQEKAYLTGNGNNRPLGVFTASADGVPTSRDVSTGNTTTSIQFDGLKEAKWTLKSQYLRRAQWLFHRDAGKQIDKLKDGEGRYIWQPSINAGVPDRMLNLPLNFSEFAPNTFTTGLYVGILADWFYYKIIDSLDLEIQRLTELYAETNQIGLIARYEGDGMPVLSEAFVRVKLA